MRKEREGNIFFYLDFAREKEREGNSFSRVLLC